MLGPVSRLMNELRRRLSRSLRLRSRSGKLDSLDLSLKVEPCKSVGLSSTLRNGSRRLPSLSLRLILGMCKLREPLLRLKSRPHTLPNPFLRLRNAPDKVLGFSLTAKKGPDPLHGLPLTVKEPSFDLQEASLGLTEGSGRLHGAFLTYALRLRRWAHGEAGRFVGGFELDLALVVETEDSQGFVDGERCSTRSDVELVNASGASTIP